MTQRIFIPLCIVAVLALGACSTLENSWEGTANLAESAWNGTRAVVNPEPKIDYDAYHIEDPNERKLAAVFSPVDAVFSELMRFVSDRDTYPDQAWQDLLFTRFPWIDGMMIVDDQGNVVERRPAVPLKRMSSPLTFKAVWRETFLKPVVDYPELGPELYLGTPYFKDTKFSGLIIVTFDPRTLFQFCPKPEDLIIIHPGGGVWSRGANVDEKAVLALPWAQMLDDDVHGRVDVGDKQYSWIARYVGQDPFVYATESADPHYDPGFWN